MNSVISFGISATGDRSIVEEVSAEVKRLGYARLWFNDTPMADGLECARWSMESAPSLSVGVGVVPIDRRDLGSLNPPEGDLTLGIGAGMSKAPLEDVEDAVRLIRSRFPDLKIAVAAMGPRMCSLAAEISDLVLLNWMTPDAILRARSIVSEVSEDRKVAAYVRVAIGEGAAGRLGAEAGLYGSLPHYARHFSRQSVPRDVVGIAVDAEEVGTHLVPYLEVLDETVVRALASVPSADAILEIARAAIR